jgi:hypothetical protein
MTSKAPNKAESQNIHISVLPSAPQMPTVSSRSVYGRAAGNQEVSCVRVSTGIASRPVW